MRIGNYRPKTNNNRARVAPLGSGNHKKPFKLDGLKGIIEPSAPRRYRIWLFIDDLDVGVEALCNDIEEGKKYLRAEIARKREIVPVRTELLERIKKAVEKNFPSAYEGYKYLNAQAGETWCSPDTERLREICEIAESASEIFQRADDLSLGV